MKAAIRSRSLEPEDLIPGLRRLAGDRPRLNLGEVGAGGSQLLERGNQRAGTMFNDEGYAEFVRRRGIRRMVIAAQ